MQSTARYLIQVFVWVILLQGILIGLTVHFTPMPAFIDTYKAFDTIYRKSVRMAVYGTPVIAKQSDQPQLIVFGISDGLLALRPEQLSRLTHLNAHNFATEQQNITSFAKLLDLVYQQTPRENWPNLNILVAVSATAFKSDAFKWKGNPTDVELEMIRYAAFRQTPSGVEPRMGKRYIDTMFALTSPFMLPYTAYSGAIHPSTWLGSFLKDFMAQAGIFNPFRTWFHTDAISNTVPAFDNAKRTRQIDYYNDYMGPPEVWDDSSFQQLEQMAAQVSAAGGNFFLVDLPMAKWLQSRLDFLPYYQKHKLPYIARMKAMPRVHYINVQHGFADDDFYDGAHTRAVVRPEIARRVAAPINRALGTHQ